MKLHSSKRRHRAAAPYFILSGALLSLIVGAFVLRRSVTETAQVTFPIAPDAAKLLPSGAAFNDFTTLQLFDEPAPAYAVGYTAPGSESASLALIRWDKQRYKYAMASTLSLVSGGRRIVGVGNVSSVELGGGAPSLIMVFGNGNDRTYPEGTMLVERHESALSIVQLRNADGTQSDAFFAGGRSEDGASAQGMEFLDVDGDGRREVVAPSYTYAAKNRPAAEEWNVHRYVDGVFVYDPELSWALATSRNVFPSATGVDVNSGP